MSHEVCKQHPTQEAVAHCPTCHVPVCPQCVLGEDGKIFCSEDHRLKWHQFEARKKDIPRLRTRRSLIVTALIVGFWVVILYFVLKYFNLLPPGLVII